MGVPDGRREVAAYGAELRRLVRYLDVGDGNLSEGSMRCDVNVSVRPVGREAFGTKVEVKNMNSFNAMSRAIDFEIERQTGLIRAGKGDEVVQETRTWDEGRQSTAGIRRPLRLRICDCLIIQYPVHSRGRSIHIHPCVKLIISKEKKSCALRITYAVSFARAND